MPSVVTATRAKATGGQTGTPSVQEIETVIVVSDGETELTK